MYKTDPRRLACTACKHENEIERVYCHNCGEKLDRSLLPQIDDIKSSEEHAKSGKKVKQMMNPNRFAWVRAIKTFVMIELFAAAVAAGFLALQAPENVPPMKTDRFPDIEISEVWAGMMNSRVPVNVTFKQFDINYYLRRAVKGSEGAMGIKFDRAFVLFEPGLITTATQRNAWGMPIYNGVSFKPVLSGGKWTADVQRLSIGRLSIPAGIGKLVKLDTLVQDALTKVFEKEIRQLERVGKIEPVADAITFVTKPAQ